MELYGYTSHLYPPRSPPTGPKMHATISFPGSSGRRSSLPVGALGTDLLASPASMTSPRAPNSPIVPMPNGREPKTPVASNGANAGGATHSPKRQRVVERPSPSKKKVEGPDARGMEDEVKRLLASCEAQEAKIKRTKANIEDRLFPDLDNAISSLADIDQEADDVLEQLDDSLNASKPILAARLSQLIATHQTKVDDMELSSTPWRELLHQSSIARDDHEDARSDAASINHEEGTQLGGPKTLRRKEEGDEAALARIEGWSGEIKNYLISEIALLKAEDAGKKRSPVWSTFRTLVSAILVLCVALFIMSLWPKNR